MKLLRYEAGNGARLGVLRGRDEIIDLAQAGLNFASMEDLIAQSYKSLDAISSAVADAAPAAKLSDVKLLSPLHRPGKFLAIGMNYKKHVEEANRLGIATPKNQYWFNKQTSCINDPYGDIERGVSEEVDYEVELGVIIGKPAKQVSAADAKQHIFGYTIVDDVSARDWQRHSPTFTLGKSFDTHGPIGPWIVTADEINDCHDLNIRCFVNGEKRQDANTSDMLYDVFKQIEYLSTAFTLESGDILATGTPEGVGVGMSPQVFLTSGDVIRCEIDGIGVIENKVL